MDKITVVCHKDHERGYEDFQGKCLLCVVEDLMREVGRLTAVCKEKEWVGLTDEEIITHFQTNVNTGSLLSFAEGARYAEAKLKENMTDLSKALAQPEQESVCAHGVEKTKCGFCKQPEQKPVEYKEYTASPKREWVGLSDEEGAEIWADAHDIDRNRLVTPKEIVRRIEAKLKEKNGG